jgi:hypothetical protein
MPKASRRQHIRLARQRIASGPGASVSQNGTVNVDAQPAQNGSASVSCPKPGKAKETKDREKAVPLVEQVSQFYFFLLAIART